MDWNISLWKEPFWSQILANPSIIWTFFTASRIYCSKVICVVLPVPWQNHRVEFSDTTPEVIPTPAGGKGFVDQEKRCTYSQPDKQEIVKEKVYFKFFCKSYPRKDGVSYVRYKQTHKQYSQ